MLDIIEKNQLSHTSDSPVKIRQEHNGFLSKEQIRRAHKTNIHLSCHVVHIYWYGRDLGGNHNHAKSGLLNDQITSMMPTIDAIKLGMRVSFYTDSPCIRLIHY